MTSESAGPNKAERDPVTFYTHVLRLGKYLSLSTTLCLLVGLLGFGLIGAGLIFLASTETTSLIAAGAALTAGALASFVAMKGIVSWAEQRQRDREAAEYRHRESVYEELAQYMIFRFLAVQTDLARDADLRARAALWGSPETVLALREWQMSLSTILAAHGKPGGGQVQMSSTESTAIKNAFGNALVAMRADLAAATGREPLRRSVLLESIFNDGSDS